MKRIGIMNIILFMVVLSNIVSIIYYIFFEYQNIFHSDSAAKNLLAQEIFETGQYFPSDWNYVNNDLWVFFGHTFIVPLLFFFKNSFILHAISGLISSFLIISATYMLACMLSKNLTLQIFSMALITSGISPYIAESLYGQVSYGYSYYMSAFIMIFSVKYLFNDNKRWYWPFLLLLTLIVVFWSNPSRAFISIGVPICFTIFVLLFKEVNLYPYRLNNEIKKLLLFFIIFIFSAIVGIILHMYSMGLTNNIDGSSNPFWLSFDLILKHLNLTFEGIMFLFNAIPTAMTPIKTPFSVYEAIRFISGLFLIYLMIYSFNISLKSSQKSIQFISTFVLALLFCTLFIYITTTVPNMDEYLASSRYLIVPILFSLLIFIATIFNDQFGIAKRTISLIVIFIFITSAPIAFLNVNLPFVEKSSSQKQYNLIDFLESKNLYYGYSTFWNAGKLTVFSKNKIRIRQITLTDGMPRPYRWLSSDRWYAKSGWIGECFLLLTKEESKKINLNLLKEMNIDIIKTFEYDGWIIYVFNDNLANHIFGWDLLYSSEIPLKPNAATPHTVGNLVFDKNQYIMHANKNEIGLLHFGPYIRINKGQYKATFSINSFGNGSINVGTVKILSDNGKFVHVEGIIRNTGVQQIELIFDISEKISDLEFHVYTNGQEEIDLYGISLVKMKELVK